MTLHAETKRPDPVEGRFRKIPVEVHAIIAERAMLRARNEWHRLPSWLIDAYDRGDVVFMKDHVLIKTPEGRMRAEPTDWLICGVADEVYPCKPSIFAKTYEHVP